MTKLYLRGQPYVVAKESPEVVRNLVWAQRHGHPIRITNEQGDFIYVMTGQIVYFEKYIPIEDRPF